MPTPPSPQSWQVGDRVIAAAALPRGADAKHAAACCAAEAAVGCPRPSLCCMVDKTPRPVLQAAVQAWAARSSCLNGARAKVRTIFRL